MNLKGEQLDELGLHPGFFTLRSPEETLSTLVHEMVHHCQQHFGRPSKGNPHNREWAARMRAIGPVPSATGLPDGKDTGHSVSHYIDPQGAFLRACRALLAEGFELPWFDRHVPAEPARIAQKQEALKAAGVAVEVTPASVVTLEQNQAADAPAMVLPSMPRQGAERVKYQCAGCGMKVWGKSDLDIRCGSCDVALVPVDG